MDFFCKFSFKDDILVHAIKDPNPDKLQNAEDFVM